MSEFEEIVTRCPWTNGVLFVLRSIGIEQVDFTFSGSGDSGDIERENVHWREHHEDGTPVVKIKLGSIPILNANGNLESLSDALEEIVYREIGSGWENDTGAWGSVTICPFESDPISHEMNDNEEDEDDEEQFDDFNGDLDEEDQENAVREQPIQAVPEQIEWSDDLPSQVPVPGPGRGR